MARDITITMEEVDTREGAAAVIPDQDGPALMGGFLGDLGELFGAEGSFNLDSLENMDFGGLGAFGEMLGPLVEMFSGLMGPIMDQLDGLANPAMEAGTNPNAPEVTPTAAPQGPAVENTDASPTLPNPGPSQ